MIRVPAIALMVLATCGTATAQNELLRQGQDLLRHGGAPKSGSAGSTAAAGLSAPQAESGMREALRVAAQRTVARVGQQDGFLRDPAIRIPLPGFLQTARQAAGAVGAAGVLDDLELKMNRAAEAAAPKAAAILADSISKMGVSDARSIITGPSDAATQYFKRTSTAPLTDAFRPIVDRALSDAGAVKAYQAAVQRFGSGSAVSSVGNLLGGSSGSSSTPPSLTDYVVEKALAGLFHYIGVEEAAIRANPAARSTDLLKQVFGR